MTMMMSSLPTGPSILDQEMVVVVSDLRGIVDIPLHPSMVASHIQILEQLSPQFHMLVGRPSLTILSPCRYVDNILFLLIYDYLVCELRNMLIVYSIQGALDQVVDRVLKRMERVMDRIVDCTMDRTVGRALEGVVDRAVDRVVDCALQHIEDCVHHCAKHS